MMKILDRGVGVTLAAGLLIWIVGDCEIVFAQSSITECLDNVRSLYAPLTTRPQDDQFIHVNYTIRVKTEKDERFREVMEVDMSISKQNLFYSNGFVDVYQDSLTEVMVDKKQEMVRIVDRDLSTPSAGQDALGLLKLDSLLNGLRDVECDTENAGGNTEYLRLSGQLDTTIAGSAFVDQIAFYIDRKQNSLHKVEIFQENPVSMTTELVFNTVDIEVEKGGTNQSLLAKFLGPNGNLKPEYSMYKLVDLRRSTIDSKE